MVNRPLTVPGSAQTGPEAAQLVSAENEHNIMSMASYFGNLSRKLTSNQDHKLSRIAMLALHIKPESELNHVAEMAYRAQNPINLINAIRQEMDGYAGLKAVQIQELDEMLNKAEVYFRTQNGNGAVVEN